MAIMVDTPEPRVSGSNGVYTWILMVDTTGPGVSGCNG